MTLFRPSLDSLKLNEYTGARGARGARRFVAYDDDDNDDKNANEFGLFVWFVGKSRGLAFRCPYGAIPSLIGFP